MVFKSSSLWDGLNVSRSITLESMQSKDIIIDASQYVGRFLINATSNLGMEYNGYNFDTWVEVPAGKTLKFTLYNAKVSSGSLKVDKIYFAGANRIQMAVVGVAMALATLALS